MFDVCSAGEIVPIADPAAFADAVFGLLSDSERWLQASAVAIARVEALYDEKDMIHRYESVYQNHIELSADNFESSMQRKVAS